MALLRRESDLVEGQDPLESSCGVNVRRHEVSVLAGIVRRTESAPRHTRVGRFGALVPPGEFQVPAGRLTLVVPFDNRY